MNPLVPPEEPYKRKDNDLDSIEVGTPAKGGAMKLYYDSTNDNEGTLAAKIDLAAAALKYAKRKLEEVTQ